MRGFVLAGVFDDGWRAELTVLGTPMNELSRIERRAKDRDIDTIASIAFIGCWTTSTLLPRRPDPSTGALMTMRRNWRR